jgi:hypothetical protein
MTVIWSAAQRALDAAGVRAHAEGVLDRAWPDQPGEVVE